VDIYNGKFKEIPIDLIISIGPWTYSFLKEAGLKALGHIPVISWNNLGPVSDTLIYIEEYKTLEINLKYDFSGTFKKAFDLFPDFRDVYVITGSGEHADRYKKLIKAAEENSLNTHSFNYITGIGFDSTLHRAMLIPEESIVFVTNFTEDINGVPFNTHEVVSSIASICRAPVFAVFDSFTRRSGSIGGYVFSNVSLGRELAQAARKILDGDDPRTVTFNKDVLFQNIYDWKLLKKWHLLNSKEIPDDSIFYNEDPSFLEKYKWYVAGFMLFLVLESLLIVNLYRLNRRQKEISAKMTETEAMYHELIREDRLSKMTELTASLSHELNQPLTAILYNAQAGKRFILSNKLDQKQADEIFDNIIEDDKRAGAVISSVRSLMKLETRERDSVNMNELVQETVDIFRNDALRHRVNVKTKFESGNVDVFADKVQLQQVLLNFFRNAVDAMEKNNYENRKLEIIVKSGKDTVTVSVRDSGPGVEKDLINEIFKPFVTKGEHHGFGIGLAVSKSIIENHDGKIWADNIPGGGAEFSFLLKTLKNG
jgi:signal transduction histidine kinase